MSSKWVSVLNSTPLNLDAFLGCIFKGVYCHISVFQCNLGVIFTKHSKLFQQTYVNLAQFSQIIICYYTASVPVCGNTYTTTLEI
jgi:hypothetical protein